jgi:hypothetical protein
MSNETLRKRLTTLEKRVAEISARLAVLGQPQDWRSTIGMFAGDKVMKRIFDEGRKIREADRRRAQKLAKKKPPKTNS